MLSKIVFVGGIHGVGKSSICKLICNQLDFKYLSASEVLKWQEITVNKKNKKVKDINYTQDRLIQGLNRIVDNESIYILDGHYCLFDNKGAVRRIPFETFKSIKPILTAIIIGDVQLIHQRLIERDNTNYDIQILKRMQELEIKHGKEIAMKLGVKFIESSDINFSNLKNGILTNIIK